MVTGYRGAVVSTGTMQRSSERLAYGEVRVGPDGLEIGIESVPHVDGELSIVFEQAVTTCRADPCAVLLVRLSEAAVEVDVVDFDAPGWPIRTIHLAHSQRRVT